MMRFRFKEKYPRGRRGSPAKGVVREERSQGSNPCFSAKQNGQANSLVRFVFRYLTTGIWTRALRKRHGASFLAADRRLLQSIKIFYTDCFAKGKNKSLFLRHKNPTYFVGFLLCSETGILHDAVHRATCGVNLGSPKCPHAKKRKRRAVFVWRKTGRLSK